MPNLPVLAWTPLASTNVRQVAFTAGPTSSRQPAAGHTGSMFVEFKSSGEGDERLVYRLDDVPYEEWQRFVQSPSPGRHYRDVFRDQYDGDKLIGDQIPD
jgi:hypothetical protein